ncbi:MAG: exonuclease SbcD [Planctomycetota bacterium]|jgi:exonuclease SbcD
MTEARLLCVGDMHLGRRPGSLPQDAPRDVGPRAAWLRVVDLAIELRVDAVLLAGDVVDSRNGYMEAYGALRSGVQRLREKDIDVVAVAGNHDVEVLPRLVDELPDVHLLGRGGTWDSFVVRRGTDAVARIIGWSFPKSSFESSPLDSLTDSQRRLQFNDDASDDLRTVGLLHCDLGETGSAYAPVSESALMNVGVSAWFLGHIHKPSIADGSRPIGYLGSLLGLDPGEPGVHGPWLAESAVAGWQLKQIECAPLRWERVDVDISDCKDTVAIESALMRSLTEVHERITSDSVLLVGVRPRLVGETKLSPSEVRSAIYSTTQQEEVRHNDVLYFFDKVEDESREVIDLESLARGTDPASLLARRLKTLLSKGDGYQEMIGAARAQMLAAVSHGRFAALGALDLEDEHVRKALIRTARRALSELLAQKKATDGAQTSQEGALA